MFTSSIQLHNIAVISCYFNPNHYETKRINYDRFVDSIKSRKSLITIECAFGSDEFDLPAAIVDRRVRSESVLWQKERLLNIVIAELPPEVTKVAWIDCDLIFENEDWLTDAAQALDSFSVVQLFEMAVRLPRNCVHDAGNGERYEGFGATFRRNPLSLGVRSGQRHGHTGFAWAARREVLRYGLYDACISGNSDHLMAHAFAGDWETPCFQQHFDENEPYRQHFESWCRATYPFVRSKIGYIPGNVLHLWHGAPEERRYMDRNRELNAFEFNPPEDVCVGTSGCYEWSSQKPDLHRWARRYFGARREDGTNLTSTTTKEILIDRISRARDRACSQTHVLRLTTAINKIASADSIEEAMAASNSALGITSDH